MFLVPASLPGVQGLGPELRFHGDSGPCCLPQWRQCRWCWRTDQQAVLCIQGTALYPPWAHSFLQRTEVQGP